MYNRIIRIWNCPLNIFLLFLIFSCEENTVNLDLDLYLKESVFYDKSTNLKYTGFVNSFYNNGKIEGKYYFFDRKGNIKEKRLYKDGNLIRVTKMN